MAIYDSILDTIGKTPVVKLNRIAPAHVSLYAKVESFNPAGSVKDRLALAIILDAEKRGLIKPGDTIVEATSGNTGVALAMVCAARGYKFVATMVETFSVERRKLMRAYGAKVILTPAAERGTGMVRKARELAEEHGWFLASQFANPANPAFHRQTTAAEILSDFAGKPLDYFVSGWGTGGTLTGVGQILRAARPETRIIATEPAGAALLAGKEFSPHKIQGWTPDFVPEVIDRQVYHELRSISDDAAISTSRRLAAEEGIFVGISAGATIATALEVAKDAPQGSVLLAMLPDTGERYFSTPLFADINDGSDDDWLAGLP
ncbi:cysteine synthase [Stenotrophomonas ginsengisoli]|uniref:Cysteine synthase n=1 Tax=Stenotrophomonas ginsengisoli TaxID=336566 RepID=A0A0R0DBX1_9GAMM|nr:cysteine synthase A [Stenotrophomonas ginsengisoli]KRG74723.1 cysteine synthase [Stenotrophomonas ginsengisoli]